MYARLLNEHFETVAVIDTYESFIWTDRYNECGDFEIMLPGTQDNLDLYKIGYYVEIDSSEHTMIVETLETQADSETGVKLKVSGRSLESILDRRIFLNKVVIPNGTSTEAKQLWFNLRRCFYQTLMKNGNNFPPTFDDKVTGAPRVIENFRYEKPSDPDIVAIEAEDQELNHGDNLYDAVVDICKEQYLGWKLIRDDEGFLNFSLYKGLNRSYGQDISKPQLPYVVFSPGYENIINSSFVNSTTTLKNVAMIVASGDNGDVKANCFNGEVEPSGLYRRETTFSLDNIKQAGSDSDKFSTRLKKKAKKELAKSEYRETKTFTGKIDAESLFVYGSDFFIGDIVEVINEMGIESCGRITEFVMSITDDGVDYYPTFIDTSIED